MKTLSAEKFLGAILERIPCRTRVGASYLTLYPHERRNIPAWTLSWYHGEKRVKKETIDAAVVDSTARTLLRSLSSGSALAANLDPKELAALAHFKLEFPNVTVAALIERYKQETPTKTQSLSTVAEIFAQMESAAKSNGRSERYLETLKYLLTHFGNSIKKPITTVTTEDIDTYLQAIPNMKTRENHRGGIVSLFRFAQKKGILPVNQLTVADLSERPTVKTSDPEIYTPEELRKLLQAACYPVDKKGRKLPAKKELIVHLVVGAFAGCRSAEIGRLTWANIGEKILLPSEITKTQRRRVAEISSNLKQWLDIYRGEASNPITFPKAHTLHKHLSELHKAAGVAPRNNGLRHSFVSYHLELHENTARTAKTAGHSPQILETKYLKLVSKTHAEEWSSITPDSIHPQPTHDNGKSTI